MITIIYHETDGVIVEATRVLHELSSHGLLDDIAFVMIGDDPSEGQLHFEQPLATCVRSGNDTQLGLYDALARADPPSDGRLYMTAVVSTQPAPQAQVALAETLTDIAQTATRLAGDIIVVPSCLAVPESCTGGSILPTEGFFSAQTANFVAVPTDWQFASGVAAGIDFADASRASWHAALELATLTSAWRVMTDSPWRPEISAPGVTGYAYKFVRASARLRVIRRREPAASEFLPVADGFSATPVPEMITRSVAMLHPKQFRMDSQIEGSASSGAQNTFMKTVGAALGRMFPPMADGFRGFAKRVKAEFLVTFGGIIGSGSSDPSSNTSATDPEDEIPVVLRGFDPRDWTILVRSVLGVADGADTTDAVRAREAAGNPEYVFVSPESPVDDLLEERIQSGERKEKTAITPEDATADSDTEEVDLSDTKEVDPSDTGEVDSDTEQADSHTEEERIQSGERKAEPAVTPEDDTPDSDTEEVDSDTRVASGALARLYYTRGGKLHWSDHQRSPTDRVQAHDDSVLGVDNEDTSEGNDVVVLNPDAREVATDQWQTDTVSDEGCHDADATTPISEGDAAKFLEHIDEETEEVSVAVEQETQLSESDIDNLYVNTDDQETYNEPRIHGETVDEESNDEVDADEEPVDETDHEETNDKADAHEPDLDEPELHKPDIDDADVQSEPDLLVDITEEEDRPKALLTLLDDVFDDEISKAVDRRKWLQTQLENCQQKERELTGRDAPPAALLVTVMGFFITVYTVIASYVLQLDFLDMNDMDEVLRTRLALVMVAITWMVLLYALIPHSDDDPRAGQSYYMKCATVVGICFGLAIVFARSLSDLFDKAPWRGIVLLVFIAVTLVLSWEVRQSGKESQRPASRFLALGWTICFVITGILVYAQLDFSTFKRGDISEFFERYGENLRYAAIVVAVLLFLLALVILFVSDRGSEGRIRRLRAEIRELQDELRRRELVPLLRGLRINWLGSAAALDYILRRNIPAELTSNNGPEKLYSPLLRLAIGYRDAYRPPPAPGWLCAQYEAVVEANSKRETRSGTVDSNRPEASTMVSPIGKRGLLATPGPDPRWELARRLRAGEFDDTLLSDAGRVADASLEDSEINILSEIAPVEPSRLPVGILGRGAAALNRVEMVSFWWWPYRVEEPSSISPVSPPKFGQVVRSPDKDSYLAVRLDISEPILEGQLSGRSTPPAGSDEDEPPPTPSPTAGLG